MASTNKTSLGLNMWEASDKPVRQDFINDNKIIDERIAKLNSDLTSGLAGKAATSHVHDDRYYTETEINTLLTAKAALNAENKYTAKQTSSVSIGINKDSYNKMQYVSEAPYSTNSATRAGYGFHNVGHNGGALYLDTDNRLKFISATGNLYILTWTSAT